MNAKETSVIQE